MRTTLFAISALCLGACAPSPNRVTPAQPVQLDAQTRAEADRAVALGTQLFNNDRMAWIASDIYQDELNRAGVPPPQTVDWAITRTANGGHLAAFILDVADSGGFVDGEVHFDPGVDPDACIRSVDSDQGEEACDGIHIARGVRPPSEEERAWAVARRTMLGDPELRLCSEAAPNFSIVKDDDSTIGYVLTSTLDRETVVMSGHTRYSLSSDGSQIFNRQPLFGSCMLAQREKSSKAVALMLSSTTSDLFNESHVFLMLDQRQPVFVVGRLGLKVLIDLEDGEARWRTLE